MCSFTATITLSQISFTGYR
uniref:Uncharacterized protein n=1 Tax=Anguilla anguilla TaxID=7936 RepID=A0A0E9PFY6_ANGAN